jgi:N-(2-amino-2-carboxyethyl)-L-glutamate synthase
MLEDLEKISAYIGKTPIMKLNYESADLYAKLEYNNFSGSSKDRAGFSIIYHGIKDGHINEDTTIIASSSGNMAIAIASICKLLKLKFIPVIDPNINKAYESLLNLISYKVVKVTERDKTGGYLLTRIEKVNSIHAATKNSFIADQYGDSNNFKGYYGLTDELLSTVDRLDFIFIAVSSSGTITGISKSIKEKMPHVKIIAVDVEGSVIFNQPPIKRHISGIGASQRPPIIENARIDDVIIVPQAEIVNGCFELLDEQVIFAGASSGAVYCAAKQYFYNKHFPVKPSAVLIFPDKGFTYLDTVYNKEWAQQLTALQKSMTSVSKPVLEDVVDR